MRVLYFHQHFSTASGSTGTRSYEFARALVERGHEVTIICGSFDAGCTGLSGPFHRGAREGEVDGINVIELELAYGNRDSLPRRAATFMRFALRSARIALRRGHDVIFATSTPLTAGIPGIVSRVLRPGVPFVFEVRDLWPELPRAMGVVRNPVVLAMLGVLEWASYRSARACIGLSPGMVEGIRRVAGPKKPVHMIPNGCDLDLFVPRTESLPSGRRFTALFCGAHGRANGLDAALDAAAILRDRGVTDIELRFVGDGALKPGLVARAEREGLTACAFLDPLPKRELVRMTAEADVGLMLLANVPAFAYGTSPNKFFDYIAAGLPVLVNYPGWMADMVLEHGCGLAVPPEDAEAFADALIALRDAPDRDAMGRRARALAESEFDRRALAQRFVAVLEETATRASRRR